VLPVGCDVANRGLFYYAREAANGCRELVAEEKGPLSAGILARLDEIYASVPCRPFGEPFGLGGRLANPASYRGPGGG